MLLFKLLTSKEGNSKQHFKKYTPYNADLSSY